MPKLWGAQELVDTPLEEKDAWIKPGILPRGGLLVMGGEAKIGKSVLLVDLIDKLTKGEPVFGLLETTPARVLYIEREIGTIGLRKRLSNKMNASGSKFSPNFHVISREPSVNPTTDEGREIISGFVEEDGINVLCFDPIGRWLLNDSDGREVGALFNYLEALQIKFSELAIILVHHFRKPNADKRSDYDALSTYNFRGSSRWVDAPDTIMTAGERRDSMSPGERWRLRTRWVTRHQEEPGDSNNEIKLSIGEDWSVTPVSTSNGPRVAQPQSIPLRPLLVTPLEQKR